MRVVKSNRIDGQTGIRFVIECDGSPASYLSVLGWWCHDAEFRLLFLNALRDAPYSAFRWETPSITKATASQPIEFVLLDSPGLASNPDPTPFAEHLNASQADVVEFENLGRDAVLIVPRQRGSRSAYGHLAAFVRNAPEEQQHTLWESVGRAMTRRLRTTPVWLSTAGAGVSWLHVRLDSRPKYYGYRPYR